MLLLLIVPGVETEHLGEVFHVHSPAVGQAIEALNGQRRFSRPVPVVPACVVIR